MTITRQLPFSPFIHEMPSRQGLCELPRQCSPWPTGLEDPACLPWWLRIRLVGANRPLFACDFCLGIHCGENPPLGN